jgi:hypothetical protein
MERKLLKSKQWWRVPLILLVCLIGGSSPTWAGNDYEEWNLFHDYSYNRNNNGNDPTISFEICYWDWYGDDEGFVKGDGLVIYVTKDNGKNWQKLFSIKCQKNSEASFTTNHYGWNINEGTHYENSHYQELMPLTWHLPIQWRDSRIHFKCEGYWSYKDESKAEWKSKTFGYYDTNYTHNVRTIEWNGNLGIAADGTITIPYKFGGACNTDGETHLCTRIDGSYNGTIGIKALNNYNAGSYTFKLSDINKKMTSTFTIEPYHEFTHLNDMDMGGGYGTEYYVQNAGAKTFPAMPVATITEAKFSQVNKKVTLKWTASNGNYRTGNWGTKWVIYRNGTKIGTKLQENSSNYYEYEDTSFPNEATVTYVIYYVWKGWNESTQISDLKSNEVSVNTTRTVPVKNLKATSYSDRIEFTWSSDKYPVGWGNKFKVYMTDMNGQETLLWTITPKADQTSYTFVHRTTNQHTNRKNSEVNGIYYSEEPLNACEPHDYRVEGIIDNKVLNVGTINNKAIGNGTLFYSLDAAKGAYPGVVKLSWHVDLQGSTAAKTYVIERRRTEKKDEAWATIHRMTSSEDYLIYTDDTPLPGVFYDYRVTVIDKCPDGTEVSNEKTDIGFAQTTGTVSGRITYGSAGTAVAGVDVVAKKTGSSNDGEAQYHSMHFTDYNGAVIWKYPDANYAKNKFATGDYSIQMWIAPEEYPNKWIARLKGGNRGAIGIYGDGEMLYCDGSKQYFFGHKLKLGEYNHVTITRKGNTVTCYIVDQDTDGKTILLKNSQTIGSLNLDNAPQFELGYFKGFVDEFRLWTKCLSETEILENYDHLLVGNEMNLETYWTFDEGLTSQFFDYSRDGTVYHQHHGEIGDNVKPETITPEALALKAKTDFDGNYIIQGVPFSGEGTTYAIIPKLGIHDFNPTQQLRFVSNNSLVHNGTDFTDVSSFPVSGKIFYAGTTYPVQGANLYVDGTICAKSGEVIETDENGAFLISVPIGDHFIRVEKNGHEFANGGRYPADPNNTGTTETFNGAKTLEFQDETLVNFTGRVVGGDIEGDKSVGFGLSKNNIGVAELVVTPLNESYMMNAKKVDNGTTIDFRPESVTKPIPSATNKINSTSWRGAGDDDCNKLIIHTDPATGEFSAMLPPLEYKIAPIKVAKSGLEVSTSQTIDLTEPREFDVDTLYIDDINNVSEGESIEYNEEGKPYQAYRYNKLLKQTYHSTPNFNVRQNDHDDGAFGIDTLSIEDEEGKLVIRDIYSIGSDGKPVYKYYDAAIFEMSERYTFDMEAFEEYVNHDGTTPVTDHVPLSELVVTINNALSNQQPIYIEDGTSDGKEVKAGEVAKLLSNQLQLDDKGKATYTWTAGLPNISEPYTRTISMSYEIGGREYMWSGSGMKGIVLGDMPTGNNFVTSGPDMVDMILRDPPGTGSSAEWVTGTVKNWSSSNLGKWNSETHLTTTSKLGVDATTITGTIPGVAVVNNIESKSDLEVGIKINIEGEAGDTWSRTIETTKTIATSSEPDFVGDQGDIFIGTATNVIFGKSRNLGFHRIGNTNSVKLDVDDAITTGLHFDTEFSYTQKYIENTLIPNLYALRNSLLRPVTSIEGHKPEGNNPIYVTTVSPDDPRFGLPNNDKAWGALATKDIDTEGPSYTMIDPDPNKPYQDSVQWCNNQIETWKRHLAFNEMEKAKAYELRENKDSVKYVNYSFDGGATITNTSDSTEVNGSKYDIQFALGIHLNRTWGVEIKKSGVIWDVGTETSAGYHREHEESTEEKTSFNYTLAEEGDDALTVDVYRYGAFGPIFRTRGGQTSNPYEGEVRAKQYIDDNGVKPILMEATMQIEVPEIDVDVNTVSDIPTGSAANYTLRLSNGSQIGADVVYKLFVLDETNPYGAQLSIDGKVLTEGRLIKVPGNQTLTKALQLRQTDVSVLNYEGILEKDHDLFKKGIGIVFASESQPEEIADTVFIKAFFTPSSSPVDLALSNRTINTQTGTDLTLTFSGFDRNYNGLKAFRLEYKRPGETDWTQIREYVVNKKNLTANNDTLPATGAAVSYLKSMADDPDGNYLFRCVSASIYGADEVYKYSEELALVKDMHRPMPLGIPEPSDGILDVGDEISVSFNEPIVKGQLTKERNFLLTGVLNGAEIAHETALSMQNTETTAQTEANITLAGKDFSTDMWVNIQDAGIILSHGTGSSKMSIATNDTCKLVVTLGDQTYISKSKLPIGKWAFLTLNYQNSDTGGYLSASVASDAETTTLFNKLAVEKYEGAGPLAVGKNLSGAIHELLLWDEAHDMTTALANRSKTKNPSTRHLIGYWKMDEGEGTTIRDYARNRHMTMPDETWYLNNENKAVSLDGSHYVAINTSQLQTFEGDDYALEFWMRGDKQIAEAQLAQAGEVALWLNTDGQLQLTGKGAYMPAEQMTTLATSSGNILDNAWHHIALNTLRQGAASVYVDGKRVLTTNATNVGSIASDRLLMGAKRETGNSFSRAFTGEIDEVRVWCASMSADLLNMQRKMRLTGSEAGLAAYYPFETKELDDYNQVVTLGTDSCLTGGIFKAQLLTLDSQSSTLNYVDEAPALRTKPTETNVSFSYTASDTKIVINIDEDPATIEGCTLNFTVRSVRDENGNYNDPVVWSAFVNCNTLAWDTDELTIEQPANSETTVIATIKNNGGTMQSWTLNGIPSWMRASVTSGDTNPLAETKVTFTVTESTPIGKYEETIYLTGTDGIETPLTIRVTVKGKEPDWAVNENDFEGSMILIGTLEILGVPSEDSDDIVAAFVDGECRGLARPEYNQRYDRHLLSMDIYGNNDELDKDVTFKAYDASTGITYPVIVTSEDVNFQVDRMYGKPAVPVILSAVDIQEQFTALAKGWNWLSLNVTLDEMTVPVVFKDLSASTALVKSKKISMMNYDGTWYGQSIGLNNSEMYKVQMSQADNLHIMGKKVDPQSTPITLIPGWNWVAYNGSQTIGITDAMADMDPRDGDVVKGQRGTAMYDGYEWFGGLKSLVPGQGYMIQTTDARTFRYPKAVSAAGARMMTSYDEAPSHFAPVDCHLYPSNMTVVAQVLVNGVPAAGIEVGVFDNEECRAAAVTDADGLAVLTIPGDGHATMTFRVYDGSQTAACNETLPYENDAIQGTRRSPFVVSVSPTGIENLTLQDSDSMLYDLQGRRVYRQTEGVQRSTLKKGVYIEDGQKRVKK